jgi:hypothetical protein
MTTTDLPARIDDRPSVFISHRHDDARIADVLRSFIRRVTAGAVDVFQSSYEGSGPEIGKILSQELGRTLAEAELVLLLYTVADEHWSYCMWECGVAFDPRKEDTRIIVFQAGEAVPAPLNDRVRVRLNEEESVRGFVKKFMTDSNFFPRLSKAITRFNADSREVEEAGRQLFADLKVTVCTDPEEQWPASPLFLFEMPLDGTDTVRSLLQAGELDKAHAAIRAQCFIRDTDTYGAQLFGRRSVPPLQSLEAFVAAWRGGDSGLSALWAESLVKQLAKAICWEFPEPEWALIKSSRDQGWYAPVLCRVRKSPAKQCMQFEVQFLRFELDERGAPRVQLPLSVAAGPSA